MLNAELRLTIPQVLRGYTDVINNSDGFIYSIYYMEKCLYAKDIIHLPVLPLKNSSGNVSAGLIDCSKKSDNSEYICLSSKLLLVSNCLPAILHVSI